MSPDSQGGSIEPHIWSILAATDFSIDSRHAALRAGMLAATMVCERAALLHVIDKSWLHVITDFMAGRGEKRDIAAETARALAEMIQEAQELSGYTFGAQLRTGSRLGGTFKAAADSRTSPCPAFGARHHP